MSDGCTVGILAWALRLPKARFYTETDAISQAILLLSRLSTARLSSTHCN